MYSQTILPAGVTSKNRPSVPSLISVLPLGSRCMPEMIRAKKLERGVPT